MMRITLTAMPRRLTVLAAKAAIVGALVLVAGAGWATGTVAGSRLPVPPNPVTFSAVGMLVGGAVLTAAFGSVAVGIILFGHRAAQLMGW